MLGSCNPEVVLEVELMGSNISSGSSSTKKAKTVQSGVLQIEKYLEFAQTSA